MRDDSEATGAARGHSSPDGLAAIESYLDGLRKHDLADVPFAPSVAFESPLTPKLVGVQAVTGFIGRLLPAIRDVRAVRHFVQADCVATRCDLETPRGVVPSFELFHIANGLIQYVRAFHDPRPILRSLAAAGRPLSTEEEKEP